VPAGEGVRRAGERTERPAVAHTHAANLLYVKRRQHQLAHSVPVPGEDGTPLKGSPLLFWLVVLIGAGAAVMLIANIVIASRYAS